MKGAIIGDIVGSRFEFVEDGYRGKDFALFASGCRFTDDSLMTLAVAKALLLSKGNYGYDDWGAKVTCEGSIPHAIVAFLDGENFEDVIRNAVGIGGDSDTIGAMAGSIAKSYYDVSYELEEKSLSYFPEHLQGLCRTFRTIMKKRVSKVL